ncbi:MAG TPA: aminoglycoside phosphotransferase family protein [Mycobacteriales bacterium]|nr:aminoglycoside phosphotransferase family protein [Mycobacteriales bacterium]
MRHDDPGQRLSAYVGIVATTWDGSFGHGAVRLHAGQDHDVVVLGEEAVFRFPRTQRALDALPREVAALAALRALDPGLDVTVPDVFLDCSGAVLGRAFVGQRYVPGEPLPRGSVEAVGPMAYRFAAELARVLDTLAAVDVGGPLGEVLTRAPVRPSFAAFADSVRERLGPLMSGAGRERAEAELAAVLAVEPPERPVLVHGDFGGGNLRWDADTTRLTGVLDWSQVHVGDPAYDVASVGATYGWDLAATTDAARDRAADAGLLDRARAYAGTFALQEALVGVLDGDEVATRRGLRGYT